MDEMLKNVRNVLKWYNDKKHSDKITRDFI